MKKIIMIAFLLIGAKTSFAQSDSTKVEQYCQIIATPKFLSNKVSIDIDFGEEKSYWRDTRLKNYSGNVRKFNTIIDALNFMGRDGWIFINAFPVTGGNTVIYHFAFRKVFARSELNY
ncbi:hypothetical protein FFF34_002650 [Inquilinus sp. KBS0705]|nr:hypothetical protein FFF34_002650 [Inquilinus sp. KBS0705]